MVEFKTIDSGHVFGWKKGIGAGLVARDGGGGGGGICHESALHE